MANCAGRRTRREEVWRRLQTPRPVDRSSVDEANKATPLPRYGVVRLTKRRRCLLVITPSSIDQSSPLTATCARKHRSYRPWRCRMRTQFVMAARASNHPHHLMTREPLAQSEETRAVVPPTHAGMGTTWMQVQRLLHPTHTAKHAATSTSPTAITCLPHRPTPTNVPGRTRSSAAQPSETPCERSTHTEPQTLATQAIKVSTARYTHVCATLGHHKARTRQMPQGVRKVLACLRVGPDRVGRASNKKSLIYFLLWFANSSVAGAPDKRGQWAAATAAQTAGRPPRLRTWSTKENIEGEVGEHTGTRTVTERKDGECKTLTRRTGTVPQHGGRRGATWSGWGEGSTSYHTPVTSR